jgi:hypothetical protein
MKPKFHFVAFCTKYVFNIIGANMAVKKHSRLYGNVFIIYNMG